MTNYCDKARLRELVIEAQTTGVISDELLAIHDHILGGITKRYGYHIDDDTRQEWRVWLLTHLHCPRTDKNLFAYLGTCGLNLVRNIHRRKVMAVNFTDARIDNPSQFY